MLIRQFLVATATAGIICCFGGIYKPVKAETDTVVVYLPIYGQITQRNLIAEAELLVVETIDRQLNQQSGLSSIQVAVLGDRNGEIIPILTTTVSRAQWNEDAQVKTWTQYHQSYALFQQYDQQLIIASNSTSSATENNNTDDTSSQTPLSQIDEVYDSDRLTQELAQEYLDDLD